MKLVRIFIGILLAIFSIICLVGMIQATWVFIIFLLPCAWLAYHLLTYDTKRTILKRQQKIANRSLTKQINFERQAQLNQEL